MGSNREIKSDGNVIIKGLTYPSADGSANQVLKTNGSGVLSFGDDTSGVRVVTLSNQTEANAYSTQENDFVKITGDVTLTSMTLVNVDFVLDSQTRALTIDQGSADGCSFLGGRVILKAGSSHADQSTAGGQTTPSETISITNCSFNCHKVDILQELADASGIVGTTVKDTFIRCSEYRYVASFTSLGTNGDDANETTHSTFDNVHIMAVTEGSVTGVQRFRATAAFTDVVVTSVITLAVNRITNDHSGGTTPNYELGSKTNCKQITLTNA